VNHAARILAARRRVAAFLLPTLPAAVAMASYAHGHGALSGAGLGMVVLLAIGAGAAAAVQLASRSVARRATELAPLARVLRGYRA
jgi:hypothetical protein